MTSRLSAADQAKIDARLDQHLRGKALTRPSEAAAPPAATGRPPAATSDERGAVASGDRDEPCDECESMRVVLSWTDGVVRPCPACRTAEATEFERRRRASVDPWDDPDAEPIKLTAAETLEAERRNIPGYTGPLRDRDLWEDGK